jgi:hypothetical protein
MSDSFEEDPFAPARIRDPLPAAPPSLPLIAQYGLALVFVALATGLAFLVQHLISAPNVTLIYVLQRRNVVSAYPLRPVGAP